MRGLSRCAITACLVIFVASCGDPDNSTTNNSTTNNSTTNNSTTNNSTTNNSTTNNSTTNNSTTNNSTTNNSTTNNSTTNNSTTNNGDICDDVVNPCTEAGTTCSDDVLVVCAEDADGCLVEMSTNCGFRGQVCDETAGACVDSCRDMPVCIARSDGDTFCVGNTIQTCTVGDDGCLDAAVDSDCAVTNQICDATGPVCVDPVCGDGSLDPGEECDDGNNDDGDGCDANCMLESVCGDGNLDPGEECDDGNTDDGDGCDANCELEGVCGDGTVDPGEECDDGNTDDGDGCNATCELEGVCGDGTVDPGEECDDGNTDDGDGCNATCELEASCGDGTVDPGEECDDMNNMDGDGCSATCERELGYDCSTGTCVAVSSLGPLAPGDSDTLAGEGPLAQGDSLFYTVTTSDLGVLTIGTSSTSDFECVLRDAAGGEWRSDAAGDCSVNGPFPADTYEVEVIGANATSASFDVSATLDASTGTYSAGDAIADITGGTVEPDESRFFHIAFDEDVEWAVDLTATGAGDPAFQIWSSTGTLLVTSDTAAGETITLPLLAGDFFIEVTNTAAAMDVATFTLASSSTALAATSAGTLDGTTTLATLTTGVIAADGEYFFTFEVANGPVLADFSMTGNTNGEAGFTVYDTELQIRVFDTGDDVATDVALEVGVYLFLIQADESAAVDDLSVDISSVPN